MQRLARGVGAIALWATAAVSGARSAAASETRIAYLNVSEGDLAIFGGAADNAAENVSGVATVVPYPPFAWPPSAGAPALLREDARAYLLFHLHKAFLPYNLVWTDVRPTQGPYTMIVVGGTPELLGFDRRVAGVALLDCDDVQASNLVFAFPSAVPGDLHGLFVTAAQETAHAFGLEHTDDQEDIMHARLGPAQWTFTDRVNLVTPPRLCGRMSQNSHATLLSVLGAWPEGTPKPLADGSIPDVEAPEIVVEGPLPGVAVTGPLAFTFTVRDPSGIAEVTLQSAVATRVWVKPKEGTVFTHQLNLPPGRAQVHVWARDRFGNQALKTLSVEVLEGSEATGCALVPLRHLRDRQTPLALFVLFFTLGACRLARR